MAEDSSCNGWKNYETWVTALWLDNEQGTQTYWNEQAKESMKRAEAGEGNPYADSPKDKAAMLLADQLKDEHEEAMQSMLDDAKQSASVWSDLLNAALSEVNWREVADHYIDGALEERAATK